MGLCIMKINQRSYYNLPNSAFGGWRSIESQPQNPEFRINPENFHPCCYKYQDNELIIWAGQIVFKQTSNGVALQLK